MAIFIRCLSCMKAAPREDRDAFIAKHKEECSSDARFRTFEADDETRDQKPAPAPEPEAKEDTEAKSFKKKKTSKKS